MNKAVIDYFGPIVEEKEGIPVADQRRIITRLNQKFCIEPHDAYLFQLYRNPEAALSYVFACENGPFHRMMNTTASGDEIATLEDKHTFAELVRSRGLPIVDTLKRVEPGGAFDRSVIKAAPGGAVFCKSRSGFRGIGAFSARIDASGLTGETITGQTLSDETAIRAAWDALAQGQEFLVQPLLQNHPIFAPVSVEAQPVAMRLITRRLDGGHRLIAGFLKIPVPFTPPDGQSGYLQINLPIDPETGRFWKPERSLHTLTELEKSVEDRVWERLSDNPQLPFWDELTEASLTLQEMFSSLWSLGLDWVLTPDGPRLLEGNVTWNIEKPQLVYGKGMLELAGPPGK